MTKSDIIEINGRRYNARTGELMAAKVTVSAPTKTKLFVETKPLYKLTNSKAHKLAPHARAHPPKSSVLLMRKAVKRPAGASKIKAYGILSKAPLNPISPQRHAERRQTKAPTIAKSQQISHFVRPKANAYPAASRAAFDSDPYQVSVRHIPVAMPSRAAHQSTSDMLEAALQAANGHEAMQLPKRSIKRRSRLFSRLGTA